MLQPIRTSQRRGFTLIELLVSIAIIGMLMALLLPAVQASREAARITQCKSNLRQLGLAAHMHHEQCKRFPPGVGFTPLIDGGVWAQHFFHLLPFLDQHNLHDKAWGPVPLPTGRTVMIYFPGNNKVYSQAVPTFLCPSDSNVGAGGVVTVNGTTWGASCYASNSQVFSPIPGDPQGKTRIRDIIDGTSNTIFYAEKLARCQVIGKAPDGGNLWAYCVFKKAVELPPPMDLPLGAFSSGFAIKGYFGNPNSTGSESKFQVQPVAGNCDPTRASTAHAGGILVCFGDCRVRMLSASMSDDVWWAHLTPNNEEVVPDW